MQFDIETNLGLSVEQLTALGSWPWGQDWLNIWGQVTCIRDSRSLNACFTVCWQICSLAGFHSYLQTKLTNYSHTTLKLKQLITLFEWNNWNEKWNNACLFSNNFSFNIFHPNLYYINKFFMKSLWKTYFCNFVIFLFKILTNKPASYGRQISILSHFDVIILNAPIYAILPICHLIALIALPSKSIHNCCLSVLDVKFIIPKYTISFIKYYYT